MSWRTYGTLSFPAHSCATVKDLRTVYSALGAEGDQAAVIRMCLLFWFGCISSSACGNGRLWSFNPRRRRNASCEIAIRIVLRGNININIIFWWISSSSSCAGALMAGIVGLAIGCGVLAWMLSNTLQALLYGVGRCVAIRFTTAAVALLGVTGVAGLISWHFAHPGSSPGDPPGGRLNKVLEVLGFICVEANCCGSGATTAALARGQPQRRSALPGLRIRDCGRRSGRFRSASARSVYGPSKGLMAALSPGSLTRAL